MVIIVIIITIIIINPIKICGFILYMGQAGVELDAKIKYISNENFFQIQT